MPIAPGDVLHFEYPEDLRWIMESLKFLVLKIKAPVRLECHGYVHDYYRVWWARVFGVPIGTFAIAYAVRKWMHARDERLGNGNRTLREAVGGDVFLILFMTCASSPTVLLHAITKVRPYCVAD